MKKFYIFLFFLLPLFSNAQSSADMAVELKASIDTSKKSIKIFWKGVSSNPDIFIYRKLTNSSFWGAPIGTKKDDEAFFEDLNISEGVEYDYCVRRAGYITYDNFGYIRSGIGIKTKNERGMMLLVIENNLYQRLKPHFDTLLLDLVGDGWYIKLLTESNNSSHQTLKAKIISAFDNYSGFKSIYLIGNLAIPYSGNFAPDAHPDHVGAWPADVYYGLFDENEWTDYNEVNLQATRPENRNTIDDGKFDQNSIRKNPDAAVGRLFLGKMSAFNNDTLLYQNYLSKAHQFKMNQINYSNKALIDDNFGYFGGEAFASSAFRSYSPLVDSLILGDYLSELRNSDYLMSYACGGGSYTSAGGVGSSSDFVNENINTIFTGLFGSYFGDWDINNNFLRAPLANPNPALISFWSGRPHWHLFPLGLGYPMATSTQLTQGNIFSSGANGFSAYWHSTFGAGVHIAQMGDPSIRLNYPRPVINFNVDTLFNDAHLTWQAPVGNAPDYYQVFRSENLFAPFTLLANISSDSSEFIDQNPKNGNNVYMVKAVYNHFSHSGNFENNSIGAIDSVNVFNPTNSNFSLAGIKNAVKLYPNPSKGYLFLISDDGFSISDYSIYDSGSRLIKNARTDNQVIDVRNLSSGFYYIIFDVNGEKQVKTFIKL